MDPPKSVSMPIKPLIGSSSTATLSLVSHVLGTNLSSFMGTLCCIMRSRECNSIVALAPLLGSPPVANCQVRAFTQNEFHVAKMLEIRRDAGPSRRGAPLAARITRKFGVFHARFCLRHSWAHRLLPNPSALQISSPENQQRLSPSTAGLLAARPPTRGPHR